jgi:hypothetical protein
MYWAAIREDLVRAQGTIDRVRERLRESTDELEDAVAEQVPNVRLLDMMAWRVSA